MSEIREVIGDIKKSTGNKGFSLILLILVGMFLFMLFKQSSGSGSNSTYIVPSGYTSYPDAVTNANVITDEINRNTDYNTSIILEELGDNFNTTNDYINKGLTNQKEISDKLDTNNDISAMTYYELMLQQQRDGYLTKDTQHIMKALENAGFNTSKEQTTTSSGSLLDEKASIKGGGYTTFKGVNIKSSQIPSEKAV